jgi:hypothetical protein
VRLLLAVSGDARLCKGPNDDMAWTGGMDKKTFRLLSHVGGTCFAGTTTYAVMPPLGGRRKLMRVTRKPCYPGTDVTLEGAYEMDPMGWVIGGPTLALAALDAGFIHEAFLCSIEHVKLGQAWPDAPKLDVLLRKFPRGCLADVVPFAPGYRVEVYRWL